MLTAIFTSKRVKIRETSNGKKLMHLENLPSHLYLGADVTQLARVIGKDSITH